MSNRRTRRARDRADRTTHETVRAVAGAPKTYTFTWQGKRYTLPPAAQAVANVPAGVVMDALEGNGDTADARLAFAYLKAADLDPATREALRAMPFHECADHLSRWMRTAGVAPGESERSST